MFNNLFGDGRIGGILAVVIGLCLLGLIVIYAWRAFGRGIRPAASRTARQPRLGIVDAFDLDRHRQLVLVRRDNVEHLIMIGGPNDLLIEGEIVRSQPSGAERREPAAPVAANGQGERIAERAGERQAPRMTIELGQGQAPAPGAAPSLDVKPGQPAGPGPGPIPAPSAAPSPSPAPSRPVVNAPPLRPTIEPGAGEPVTPPPPLARPPSAPLPGARPMPPRPVPPVRPVPPPPSAAPRPGAPTLAQRPVTAPSVTPPAPPAPEADRPSEPEREPAPAKETAPEPPKLSLNIDSLEEEMAKLLGRPVEPPKN